MLQHKCQVLPPLIQAESKPEGYEVEARGDDGYQRKTDGMPQSENLIPTIQNTRPALASHFPVHQVERTAKQECMDMILKENPNSFPINCVLRVSFFAQKLNLWKRLCGGYSPITLLKADNQTHWILVHQRNLNVIRSPHFTCKEVRDRRRKERKLT